MIAQSSYKCSTDLANIEAAPGQHLVLSMTAHERAQMHTINPNGNQVNARPRGRARICGVFCRQRLSIYDNDAI